MQLRVLLLEDDVELSETIAKFLRSYDFEVVQSYDGEDAATKMYEEHFDLWLLDVKVPLQDGIALLEQFRKDGNDTPAIFITSLHGVDDATKGFEAGGDDYIRKPFALKELLARIEAVMKRRYHSSTKKVIIDKRRSFDIMNMTLYKDDKPVPLKPKEAKLLALFLQNPDKVLKKEEIFDALWEYGETPNEGSLRTYIKILRKELGKEKIETIKEVGYRYRRRG